MKRKLSRMKKHSIQQIEEPEEESKTTPIDRKTPRKLIKKDPDLKIVF